MKKSLLATALLTVAALGLTGCTSSSPAPKHSNESPTVTSSATASSSSTPNPSPSTSATALPAVNKDYYFSSNTSLSGTPQLFLVQNGKRTAVANSTPVSVGSCKLIGSVTTFPGKETTTSAAARESVSDSILNGFFATYPADKTPTIQTRMINTTMTDAFGRTVQVEERHTTFTSSKTKTTGFVSARYFNGNKAYIYAAICLNSGVFPSDANVVFQP